MPTFKVKFRREFEVTFKARRRQDVEEALELIGDDEINEWDQAFVGHAMEIVDQIDDCGTPDMAILVEENGAAAYVVEHDVYRQLLADGDAEPLDEFDALTELERDDVTPTASYSTPPHLLKKD